MQTSSVLSSAALPQFIQSLTPVGGSGSRSSKERTVEGCAKNAASSFTSQEICAVQVPQCPPLQHVHEHHLIARSDETIHSSHQQLLTACSKVIDPSICKDQVDSDVSMQSSDHKSLQQQQKAAIALSKYQEFIRQQQQMPPPQSNPSNSAQRADVIMVSIGQQTSQPQLLVNEARTTLDPATEVAASDGPPPLQQQCDSSKTATLTPASTTHIDTTHTPDHRRSTLYSTPPVRGDGLLMVSSQNLSQSLSLNHTYFPTSPSGVQAASSPMASRLPKVLPSGDGRAGFIVLPAAAHAEAASSRREVAAAISTGPSFHAPSGAGGEEAPFAVQLSAPLNQSSSGFCEKSSTSKHIFEIDSSDAETQYSALSEDGQEETLVIPETPTGTPNQTRIEDKPVANSRCPRPQPFRLADTADATLLGSCSKSVKASGVATSSRKTRFDASIFLLCMKP